MKNAILMLTLAVTLSTCAVRTDALVSGYVGKSIDAFMKERAFVPTSVKPMPDGMKLYEFTGGPGGEACRFFFVTDADGIIKSTRYENC